jgi:hypothetical protein
MSEQGNQVETIPLDEAKHQVALASRRLGLLHLAFAEVLVDTLGEEEGRKTIVRAIEEYSKKIDDLVAKKDSEVMEV